MALVSLKQEEDNHPKTMCCDSEYGYGTSISLNGEQCEAMGISRMAAGQCVMISAKGIVTRVTEELESGTDSGGKDISLCIQLTDMEVSNEGNAKPMEAATMLYGDND